MDPNEILLNSSSDDIDLQLPEFPKLTIDNNNLSSSSIDNFKIEESVAPPRSPVLSQTPVIEPMQQQVVPQTRQPMQQQMVPQTRPPMQQQVAPQTRQPMQQQVVPQTRPPMQQQMVQQTRAPMQQQIAPQTRPPMQQEIRKPILKNSAQVNLQSEKTVVIATEQPVQQVVEEQIVELKPETSNFYNIKGFNLPKETAYLSLGVLAVSGLLYYLSTKKSNKHLKEQQNNK